MGLTNVRFARLDGKAFVLGRVPEASLDALHVFFPDPWPKKRHAKRRLFSPDFVRAAALALVPGGLLRVATDNLPYFEAIREVLDAEPALEKVPRQRVGLERRDRLRAEVREGGAADGPRDLAPAAGRLTASGSGLPGRRHGRRTGRSLGPPAPSRGAAAGTCGSSRSRRSSAMTVMT